MFVFPMIVITQHPIKRRDALSADCRPPGQVIFIGLIGRREREPDSLSPSCLKQVIHVIKRQLRDSAVTLCGCLFYLLKIFKRIKKEAPQDFFFIALTYLIFTLLTALNAPYTGSSSTVVKALTLK